MSFIAKQSQRNQEFAKVADVVDVANLEHSPSKQQCGLTPSHVSSDGAALTSTASVHPTRLPSIQARRARRPSPLSLSMLGSTSFLNTPKAAVITTVPVTTTKAPVNGGVLFVPPTRSSNIRRRPSVKTRRSGSGKAVKASAPKPLFTGGFTTRSNQKTIHLPPVSNTVMNSNGEIDMDYYRSRARKIAAKQVDPAFYRNCALRLAGMPAHLNSIQSEELGSFGL